MPKVEISKTSSRYTYGKFSCQNTLNTSVSIIFVLNPPIFPMYPHISHSVARVYYARTYRSRARQYRTRLYDKVTHADVLNRKQWRGLNVAKVGCFFGRGIFRNATRAFDGPLVRRECRAIEPHRHRLVCSKHRSACSILQKKRKHIRIAVRKSHREQPIKCHCLNIFNRRRKFIKTKFAPK